MDKSDIKENIAHILIDKDIVTFNFDVPYVFTTGLKSPVYIDNRLLISYPRERTYAINEIMRLIKENIDVEKIDFIASSLSFAAPFGVLIANALDLPLVLIRDRHSIYGKKIEGIVPKGKEGLIVEEHVSTGAAIVHDSEMIREAGGKVNYCVAVTDHGINLAHEAVKNSGITVFSIAKTQYITDEAEKMGKITKKQKEEVMEWIKNPVKWGQERGYYSGD